MISNIVILIVNIIALIAILVANRELIKACREIDKLSSERASARLDATEASRFSSYDNQLLADSFAGNDQYPSDSFDRTASAPSDFSSLSKDE